MQIKTFIVLGMHRSATSLAAKGLHDAGVNMGESLLGESASNPWGHFEDVTFVYLNDEILAAAGGAWDRPPAEAAIMAQQDKFAGPIKELICYRESFVQPDYPIWGWKDPRTTLTIRLFLPYLKNPHFVSCFRDPEDVAISLGIRNKMPISKGIELAKEYNRRLVDFLTEFGGVK